MIFTSIGARIDRCLARADAFAHGSSTFPRDPTGEAPVRPNCNPSPKIDPASDHGRDLAHRVLLRLLDGEQSPGSAALIRIPRERLAFEGSPIRPLGLADIYPLMLSCEGRVQYREDHCYGTYQVGLTIHLGEQHRIKDAISTAALILAHDSFSLDDDEALGFWPDLFVVRDQMQRLVLAGQAWGRDIKWCEPVASDDQIARVRAEVDQTYEEASFEAGWDNHETARQLRRRAKVLKGHLVDVAWRARARNALAATGARRSPCPSPSDPLPVPSCAGYRPS